MKGLDLPPDYVLDESDRPVLHILQPSGRRIPGLVFSSEPNPHLVNEAVWVWHLDTEDRVRQTDTLLGREEYANRPSVHDLLCEALDATGWTGSEKQVWLESCHSAVHRHLRERCRRAS